MNVILWILQVLLALMFCFAGGTKLILPMSMLQEMSPPDAIALPGWFIRFIGVCELLGALGLVLPGIFKTRQYLTPLAAAGLTIIMIGAVVTTVMGPGAAMAVTPFIFVLLLGFVAYGRWHLRPLT